MLLRIDALASAPSLHDEADVRAIEQQAANSLPPHALMQRAGAGVARLVRARFAHARRVLVLCGPGNNGGDGLVAAALLAGHGLAVTAVLVGGEATAQPRPDAAWALELARAAGVQPRAWDAATDAASMRDADLVVDALLGIGLRRPPSGSIADAVRAVLACALPVLAVDVPSGIAADTGHAPGAHIRATVTLTMLAAKPGLFTGQGAGAAGDVWLDDLGVVEPAPVASARLFGAAQARAALPPLAAAPHKGARGGVHVFGGASGMDGAALLAARAALALGAGRVWCGFLDSDAPPLDPAWPELMIRTPAAMVAALEASADDASRCVVFGPGAGRANGAHAVLSKLLALPCALLIDADGLNLLAAQPRDGATWRALRARGAPTWITPHPGEAANLLGRDAADVQADRPGAARALATFTGATCVLKGAGSVVAAPSGDTWINLGGNGLLATAGSGDVLSGAIAALLAQTRGAPAGGQAAVWLHGAAADRANAQRHALRVGTLGEAMAALRAAL